MSLNRFPFRILLASLLAGLVFGLLRPSGGARTAAGRAPLGRQRVGEFVPEPRRLAPEDGGRRRNRRPPVPRTARHRAGERGMEVGRRQRAGEGRRRQRHRDRRDFDGSPPGARAVHAFPMDDLDGWSDYVAAVVGRYKKQVRHWEVWNEGNGGFNDGRNTTADYARLVAATYAAAKRADPEAKVGVTVASFDSPYLDQTFAPGEGRQAGQLRLPVHSPLRNCGRPRRP